MNTFLLILLILAFLEGVVFSDDMIGIIAHEWGLEKSKKEIKKSKEKRENG